MVHHLAHRQQRGGGEPLELEPVNFWAATLVLAVASESSRRRRVEQVGTQPELLERAPPSDTAAPLGQLWTETMMSEELGYGSTEPNAVRAALATLAAFVTIGFLPLMVFVDDIAASGRASSTSNGGGLPSRHSSSEDSPACSRTRLARSSRAWPEQDNGSVAPGNQRPAEARRRWCRAWREGPCAKGGLSRRDGTRARRRRGACHATPLPWRSIRVSSCAAPASGWARGSWLGGREGRAGAAG
jgi:hypothetical protein